MEEASFRCDYASRCRRSGMCGREGGYGLSGCARWHGGVGGMQELGCEEERRREAHGGPR